MKSAFFTLFIAAFFSSELYAFTISIDGIKGFKGGNVKFYLNDTNCPSGIKSDIEAAVDLWNSTPTSNLEVELAGTTTITAASLRTQIAVGGYSQDAIIACSTDFATDSSNYYGNGGCSGSCLESVVGVGTSIALSGSKLEIGYLILNMNSGVGGNYGDKSGDVRQIILAHEMGHVLGLGHSEEEAALMHFSVAEKGELNLHQDDIDGISYLYPRDELNSDGMFGCGTVATVMANKLRPRAGKSYISSSLWNLVLFLPLFLLMIFRVITVGQKLRN